MVEIDNLIKICEQKKQQGNSIEEILQFLRTNNCSKATSIYILLKMRYLSPDKAKFTKHLVHFSKTWEDLRDSHKDWHEKLIEAFEQEFN